MHAVWDKPSPTQAKPDQRAHPDPMPIELFPSKYWMHYLRPPDWRIKVQ